jgi:hypothetical protein
VLPALLALVSSPAWAASGGATAQLGFVIDLGREPRPGIELSLGARLALDGEFADPIVAFGGLARAGWRRKLGITAALLGRVGVADLLRCGGSSHVVYKGGEIEGGAELATGGAPAALLGVNATFPAFPTGWGIGPPRSAHLDMRLQRGAPVAFQLGHAWGVDFPFPQCGWESE